MGKKLLIILLSISMLFVITAGLANARPGSEITFLKQGWDDFSHPLIKGMVIWNQTKSGMFQVTYVLEGASPNHTYQVGIHLFLNEVNESWDDFGPDGWEDNLRVPGGEPVCRVEDSVEYCGNLNAWEFGFLTTDVFGDGAAHFNLHPNPGTYYIQFNVRYGTCGAPGEPSGCNVVFESGGPFTTYETIEIEQ
jgi:hypothetical protein